MVLFPHRRPLALTLVTLACTALSFNPVSAQETRGTIFGTVKDASGGVLAGMSVIVTNEETNVSNESVTNERGGFEIPYLLPGTYRVVVQADGFKKFTTTGLLLTVNNRVGLDVTLEVGTMSDEVTVTSQLPLLETTASASATLSNRQVNALPVFGNSALLLARSVPGMQWTGQPNYLGLHSNVGASAVQRGGRRRRHRIFARRRAQRRTEPPRRLPAVHGHGVGDQSRKRRVRRVERAHERRQYQHADQERNQSVPRQRHLAVPGIRTGTRPRARRTRPTTDGSSRRSRKGAATTPRATPASARSRRGVTTTTQA